MNDKSILVTGAAGGIGRAACERLARGGWQVLAVDIDADKLSWTDGVDGVLGHVADTTLEADNAAMVARAEAEFGGLDAAILNAAVTMAGGVEAMSWERFEQVIGVNVFGTTLGLRAVLPALRRRGGGAIVATSSMFGLNGEAGNCGYAASKHAVIGLVRSVARDVGWEGIRINAVCPGTTRATGMTTGIEQQLPELYEDLARKVPLQRWAEADEIAAVMEFLVSPASSYINGAAIPVDGGAGATAGLRPPADGPEDAVH